MTRIDLTKVSSEELVAEVQRRRQELEAITRLNPAAWSSDVPTPSQLQAPRPKAVVMRHRKKSLPAADLLASISEPTTVATLVKRFGLSAPGLYTRLNAMVATGQVTRTSDANGHTTYHAKANAEPPKRKRRSKETASA